MVLGRNKRVCRDQAPARKSAQQEIERRLVIAYILALLALAASVALALMAPARCHGPAGPRALPWLSDMHAAPNAACAGRRRP